MSGLAEHAKQTGFAEHSGARPGFAQFGGRSMTYARPNEGFAAMMAEYEAKQARQGTDTEAVPRKKRRPHKSDRVVKQAYGFPDITVGRKVDFSEAHKWRDYPQKLEMRNHGWKLGSMISLRNVICVYFTPEEINGALTERYKAIAHDPNDAKRARAAREFCLAATGEIQNMRRERDDFVINTVMNVDQSELRRLTWDKDVDREQRNEYAKLYNQIESSGYETDDRADFAKQILLTKPDRLWAPQSFGIGDPDNIGPLEFGFNIVDEERILASERSALISRFTDRFGLNRLHFSDDWSPQVAFIDLIQPGVEGMHKRLAAAPIELPLKQPGAYIAA